MSLPFAVGAHLAAAGWVVQALGRAEDDWFYLTVSFKGLVMRGHYGRRGAGAALLAVLLLGGCAATAPATQVWDWAYTGTDIKAAGTLTTEARPDSAGFYRILAIEGRRDGAAIVRLWPAGTSIPCNGTYTVDNLIKPDAPQLTKSGFGFALADGGYANAFYADFATPPTYLEFHASQTAPCVTTEPPVTFKAVPR